MLQFHEIFIKSYLGQWKTQQDFVENFVEFCCQKRLGRWILRYLKRKKNVKKTLKNFFFEFLKKKPLPCNSSAEQLGKTSFFISGLCETYSAALCIFRIGNRLNVKRILNLILFTNRFLSLGENPIITAVSSI